MSNHLFKRYCTTCRKSRRMVLADGRHFCRRCLTHQPAPKARLHDEAPRKRKGA